MEQVDRYRLEESERKLNVVCEQLGLVMTNHLPHIQVELEKINGRLDSQDSMLKWLFGLISGAILSSIAIGLKLLLGG